MGVTFIGTHVIESPGFATMLLRSGAEAGIVGGFADWFAVTALFRHPLGLPIPHTAIVPSNKNRIARTLGGFVERNFLTEDVLLKKLREIHAGRRFAAWLAAPDTAPLIAGSLVGALPYLIRSLESRDLHDFAHRTLGEQLREADIAPILGRIVHALTASGEADILFERAVGIAARWLQDNAPQIDQLVQERSHWWIPRTINRRIAAAIVAGVTDVLHGLQQPDSEARLKFREALSGFVDDLANSPQQRAQVNAAKNRILDHPDVQAWLASVWHDLSQAALADLENSSSKMRTAIEKAVTVVGQALSTDEAMQRHIDSALERLTRYLISWRGEIGGFITEVVKSWDTRSLSDRLELVVGSDLQYIRMNGTVVGAVVGCLIFIVSWLLGSA
jgi:uncharacterized membrane-anchored protein YjiN (DUF445 family)